MSFVLKNNLDLKGEIKTLSNNAKIAGLNVRFISCDNSGKNITTKNDPEIISFGVQFGFPGPRIPQRNKR
jgi:hypothetical protein